MTPEWFFYLTIGALAAGFINGLAGTGSALFALGFYLVVLEPVEAVAVLAFVAILTGLQGVWIVRHHILAQPVRILRFVIPGVIGVPIGLSLLAQVEASTLRIAVATLLIFYGAFFGFRTALPAFSRRTPIADSVVGLTGGILGGAAAVSGALPQIWLTMRPWAKSDTRAVLQAFNLVVLGTTVILLAFKGAYDQTVIRALVVTIPVGMIAAQLGILVFKRLSDSGFRRLLILLTLIIGVGMIGAEVF